MHSVLPRGLQGLLAADSSSDGPGKVPVSIHQGLMDKMKWIAEMFAAGQAVEDQVEGEGERSQAVHVAA